MKKPKSAKKIESVAKNASSNISEEVKKSSNLFKFLQVRVALNRIKKYKKNEITLQRVVSLFI